MKLDSLIVLSLFWIKTIHCGDQVDVLKIANVPFPRSSGKPASVSAPFKQNIPEFTFCYRLLFEFYNDFWIDFIGAVRSEEQFHFREVFTYSNGMEVDGYQSGLTFLRRNVPGGGIGGLGAMPFWHHLAMPRTLETGQFHHFCTAYSSTKHKLHRYLDGLKVFSVDYTDEIENPLPSTLFELVKIGENFRGLFTELNIYSDFFAEEAMIAWTTRCNPEPGDIFTWDGNKVNISKEEGEEKIVTIIKMDKSEVCPDSSKTILEEKPTKAAGSNQKKRFKPRIMPNKSSLSSVLEYIEDHSLKSADMGKDMCFRLNGELMTVPQSEDEAKMMEKILRDYMRKKVSNNQTYIDENKVSVEIWVAGETSPTEQEKNEAVYSTSRVHKYAKNGVARYVHPITQETLSPLRPMLVPIHATDVRVPRYCITCIDTLNEPDKDSVWWREKDVYCINIVGLELKHNGVICQFSKEPTFRLRGLCKDALMDTQYKFAEFKQLDLRTKPNVATNKDKREYVGPKGWTISYNSTEGEWRMSHYHYTELTLTMLAKDVLPVGTHKWRVENNVCQEGETSVEILQLSACDEGQFTCDDGKCLDIAQRCNNIEERQVEERETFAHPSFSGM